MIYMVYIYMIYMIYMIYIYYICIYIYIMCIYIYTVGFKWVNQPLQLQSDDPPRPSSLGPKDFQKNRFGIGKKFPPLVT